jgi:hypothetical protein
VDSADTSEAGAEYTFNHRCRHGGPDIEHNPPLHDSLVHAMQVLGRLPERDAARELRLLCSFARATPPHAKLHLILLSCGCDALVDNNVGIARRFVRIAFLCRALLQRPSLLAELEAALQGQGGGAAGGGGGGGAAAAAAAGAPGTAAMRALAEQVTQRDSYTGLLAALRQPMTCSCLQPLNVSALPLTDPQSPGSGDDGGAAGDPGAAHEGSPSGGAAEAAAAAAAAAPEPPTAAAKPVEEMSVKELKAALLALGVPTAGLLEKADLQQALRNALPK